LVALDITAEEVRSGQMTPAHLAAAVEALRTEGYVILNDVIDRSHLDLLRERMLEEIPRYLAREDVPFNWNVGNLQQAPPPFPPYLFRDVLVNDLVIAVSKAVLGPGVHADLYTGNTAMPGASQRQPVHFDFRHLWPDLEVAPPAHGLVINVPVVDMYPENGSTEIWPGSHRLTTMNGEDIKLPPEAVEARRAVAPPLQPVVRCGGVLIRDGRIWHAGMPNRTETPRPLIAMAHWIRWYRYGSEARVAFPKGSEESVAHPDLRWNATFTDDPVDHIAREHAYEYQP
jgi:ectoine hydroxylase-related dioxygenase (phytanoyl-CoA dioxygenase family)